MTQPGEALDRVLGVLTNEGWAADPDATEYNLRVAALVLDAATPVAGGLDVEQLFSDLEMGLGDESHVAAVIAKYRAALAASQPVAEEGDAPNEVIDHDARNERRAILGMAPLPQPVAEEGG